LQQLITSDAIESALGSVLGILVFISEYTKEAYSYGLIFSIISM